MFLKEISRRLRETDEIDADSTLSNSLRLQDLSQQQLSSFGDTIFLLDQEGTATGKVQRDLLEYLLAQQQEKVFTQILNHVHDGIIAVDASGRIYYLNQAYTDILNVKPYKIIGRYIQDVEPDSLLTRTLELRQPIESNFQKISSVKKYVSLNIVPLFSNGTFAGAISYFRDVTALHDLDKKVRKMTNIAGEYSKQLQDLSTLQALGVLTQDRVYLKLLSQAAVVAKTDVPILIRGENGVGKEVLANYIHQCSGRTEMPLITVNCAAIPQELLESELFGYEEGAFTGAAKGGRKGKFELADKGTIFLDEIGDMPVTMQSKLLRVIQQGEIEKLGRQRTLHVDVRILAATNQPLEQLIAERRFRQDLFFRLNTFMLQIPPLRDRPDDVVLLADYFMKHYNEKYQKRMCFSGEAYAWLQRQQWPGNVRELQSCVERAVIMEDESFLTDDKRLPQDAHKAQGEPLAAEYKVLMWRHEDQILRQALQASNGSRALAIKALGLSQRTFYRKCAEHNL